MKEVTLSDLAINVTAKATAFASLHGIEPTQAEIDDLYRVFGPRKWRWWLNASADYQGSVLKAWLEMVRRMRGGGSPPASGDPTMLAIRALSKIEELAASAASAVLAMVPSEKESES